MSIRVINETLTASASYQPPYGRKWKVLMVLLTMVTGTGAGSRSIKLQVAADHFFNPNIGLLLAQIPTETGTSTDYAGGGGPSPSGQGINNWTALYPDVIITAYDSLSAVITAISGDTFYVYASLDEVADGEE